MLKVYAVARWHTCLMSVTFKAQIVREGNHASIVIPDEVLSQLGSHKRAPLLVSINGHTYQSTATAIGGECRVVFPKRDREASGSSAALDVEVTLTLDAGVREVLLPEGLRRALSEAGLLDDFDRLSYSKRNAHVKQVSTAKTAKTQQVRIAKVLETFEPAPKGFPIIDGMRTIAFGAPGSAREKLNALVLYGDKRATAGLFEQDYQAHNEPLEHVGEKLAMVDSSGKQVATLLITRAELIRFADVPDEFAIAEGEGDFTGDQFRAGYLKDWIAMGYTVTDDSIVTNVYFELFGVGG